MLKIYFAVFFHLRAVGCEYVPRSGGVLLVANHQSYFDPILVVLGLPQAVSFMARRTLFRFAPFRWLIVSLGAFPLGREAIDVEALKEGIRRLRAGKPLMVFPEGTRTRDGSVGEFRPGFLMMAERSGALVVPVAIAGADCAWHRSKPLPRYHPIRVSYGEPVTPTQLKSWGRELTAQIVRQRIVAMAGRESQKLFPPGTK